MSAPIAITVTLQADTFAQAIEKVTAALQAVGFGLVAQLDLRAKFQDQLEKDYREYTILGACNPPLAFRALQSNRQAGLLLPCNVVVEETGLGYLVSAANPRLLMGLTPFSGNPELAQVADEAYDRLHQALRTLGETDPL